MDSKRVEVMPVLSEELRRSVDLAAQRLNVGALTEEQLRAELMRAQEHNPLTGHPKDCEGVVALREELNRRREAD
ncbi:hypothetical protein [Ralstonia pseudosolanacearum]|uniref:hypothetical protein n=1 Tax=Ralstonia pseudosolanacearum TaxID=1310165 RepID=UPI003CEF77D3